MGTAKWTGGELDMLRTILQHCSGTVFVTDSEGRIIYSNEESSRALGCPTDELLHMTIYDLVERGLTSSAVSPLVIEQKRTISSRVYYNDGRETVVTGEPVFDENGDLVMVVVYGQKRETISNRIRSLEENNAAIRQALTQVMQDNPAEGLLVAESPATRRCLELAEKAAHLDSTIMLYGESGTGKEVVSRYIHRSSSRARQVFLPVNCAAIPQELMESEFFGYEKGAFTGSRREGKLGLFEIADGGTLFLDEIGELNLPLQSKLLRVLATGEIKRVGGNDIRKVNVRIVAATNRNLWSMIAEGSFREDLFYRLNVIPITVPPLRERQEDTAVFSVYFMDRLNKKYSAHKQFTQEALEVLQSYSWPGNVRELRNVIERIFVIVSSDTITARNVSDVLGVSTPASPAEPSSGSGSALPDAFLAGSLHEATERFQRAYIARVLRQCGGNVTQAAEQMQLGRSGLYKKLEKLGGKARPRWLEDDGGFQR